MAGYWTGHVTQINQSECIVSIYNMEEWLCDTTNQSALFQYTIWMSGYVTQPIRVLCSNLYYGNKAVLLQLFPIHLYFNALCCSVFQFLTPVMSLHLAIMVDFVFRRKTELSNVSVRKNSVEKLVK